MTEFSSDTVNALNTRLSELNLDKSVLIDIPKDIIFPNELNKFLKEKVEYLSYENGMLKKNVYDYELKLKKNGSEIKELNEKLKSYETTNEFASVATVARTKIVELSKKLREKNCELEVLKSKYSRVEQELTNVKMSNTTFEITKPVKDKKAMGDAQSELKMLNEKFTTVNSKLFDEKNANLLLKNELKMAHKLLQEEIGETFESVQQISNNHNWKGRAQIISDLQHKNNELKEKLRTLQDKDGVKINDQLNQKRQIWEHKLDKANKEMEILKTLNSDCKKKLEAAKSRSKTMEIESSMWKTKYNAISEQSERDRELISTVTSQQTANFNAQNEMMKKKEHIIEKLHKEIKNLKQDLKMEACKVENLQTMIEERDAELEKTRKNAFSFPHEGSKMDDRIIQRIEAEQIRFTELIVVLNQRLNAEREEKCNAEYLHRQERQRAAKLEAKLTRLQLGEFTDRSSSYSALLSKYCPEDDKNSEYKLELAEENIKALQTRLQIEKREKERDLMEFTKILRNCKCSHE